jgi:hypothetical protein
MIQLTLEKLDLLNPTWGSATLQPGHDVAMNVEAPSIAAPQYIHFAVLRGAETLDHM